MNTTDRSLPADASIRSPKTIRFFGQHYHFLKGWCYAPAGLLLLVGALALAWLRPDWLVPVGGMTLGFASIALTAPWAWHMHRRYEDRYGRVRTPDDDASRGLLGGALPSAPATVLVLLAAFSWIAVCFIHIPQSTPIADNHFMPLFAGYYLLLLTFQAPDATTRGVYISGALPLVAATLLPLVYPDPWTVAVANYGGLGAVAAGIGVYNHRLLAHAFGPFADR